MMDASAAEPAPPGEIAATPTEPAPPTERLAPRLIRLLVLEGAALSLPMARGAWLYPSLLALAVGVAAFATRRRAVELGRAGLAVAAAVLCGIPQLAAVQLAVAGSWWSVRARRRMVFATMAIALLASRAEELFPVPPPDEDEITLVTANIYMPLDAAWEERFAAGLRGVEPDIVVLQETHLNQFAPGLEVWERGVSLYVAGATRLGEKLGLPHHYLDRPGRLREPPYQSGVGVMSRFPLRIIPETVSLDLAAPPPALEVRTPQGPIALTPVHIATFLTPPGRRKEGIAALLARFGAGRPRIVVGDLNATPAATHPLLAEHGFVDAATTSRFSGVTFHTWVPFTRIDAALLSPEIEPRLHRVLPGWGSDHRAVVVRFRVR